MSPMPKVPPPGEGADPAALEQKKGVTLPRHVRPGVPAETAPVSVPAATAPETATTPSEPTRASTPATHVEVVVVQHVVVPAAPESKKRRTAPKKKAPDTFSLPEPPPILVDHERPLPPEFTEKQFTKIVVHIIGERGIVGDLSTDWLTDFLSEHYKLDRTGVALMRQALEERGVIGHTGVTRKILVDRWPLSNSAPQSTQASSLDAAPATPAPDPDAPKPLIPVKRPRLSSLPARAEASPAPASPEPAVAAAAPTSPEPAPATPAIPPRRRLSSLPGRAPAPAPAPEAAPAAPPEPPETAPAALEPARPILTRAGGAAADLTTPEPAPARRPLTIPTRVVGSTLPPSQRPEAAPATPPTPPEPAPVTPPEAAPATPPATPETPPTPPAPEAKQGFFDSITSSFRGAADRFMARFRGEVTAKDEKDYKPTGSDVSKSIAAGLMSVVASYTGIKIVADLPEWLTQKYFTAQERKLIKDALKSTKTEPDNVTEDVISLETRMTKLEEAIRASKFLTVEKQKALIQQAQDALNRKENDNLMARTKRDKEIALLIDAAIQSRIKNTQVLKETLNSALMLTGLSAMRGVAYGSVALYERYSRLSQEKKAHGVAPGVSFNELIVGGMKETWAQLKGGGAETTAGKALNFVQGATVVLRAAGFAELAISEVLEEGGASSMINASLKAWEEKSAGQFALDNAKEPWQRLGSLFGMASDALGHSPTGDAVTGDKDHINLGASDATTGQELDAFGNPIDFGTSDANTGQDLDEFGKPTGVVAPIEFTENQIKTGMVHKGDGIIKILQRQGLSAKAALDASREAGIVRPDGDTRLATEAIGRISVLAHETDGHVVIAFHDAQTGNTLSLDEARAQGFTYEHGSGSPTIAEPPPATEGTTEVPHALAGGNLNLNTIEGGFNFNMDTSGLTSVQLNGMTDVNAIEMAGTTELALQQEDVKNLSQRMVSTQTILHRLDARHLGDSAEAQVLRLSLQQDLAQAQSMNVFDRVDLQKIQVDANRFNADALQSVQASDRLNDIRIPGLGKIEFTYDADGKPEFDLHQLITDAKPILQSRAANMLVEGWENTVAGSYISQQEIAVAGPVYLMNEALKELKAGGHGESAQAKFLTTQLGLYLRENAGVLDGNNAIVKDAAERAGVDTVIFQRVAQDDGMS